MKYIFPKNFKWGSAVWAQGTEGGYNKDGKSPTVWDEYYRLHPERFFNKIGPSETLGWYDKKFDVASLVESVGHNSFRTSIMWTRLIPDGKNINEKAVEFYKDMFQSFKEKNIELSVVLYWFDMPLMYENEGGFSNRKIIEPFVYYCQKCFELFDDLVDIWYIYNEPFMDAIMKYENGLCYPNEVNWNKLNNAIYNMVIAHAKVVELYKNNNYDKKIGSVLNHAHVYSRSNHLADQNARDIIDLLKIKCFEDPLLGGYVNKDWMAFVKKYGANLNVDLKDEELIKNNTIQIVGLNIYGPLRVKCPSYIINPHAPITTTSFYEPYDMPGKRMNKYRGWEIYPQCLYDAVMDIKKRYNNPEMRITENGIGVQNESRFRGENGQIQDDYRIDFVKEHLLWVHKAIEDGANLVGYNMWSFIDLWSPSNQFKNCYGFFEYDLKTEEIKRKKSADWFEKISKDNFIEI